MRPQKKRPRLRASAAEAQTKFVTHSIQRPSLAKHSTQSAPTEAKEAIVWLANAVGVPAWISAGILQRAGLAYD